MMDYWSRRDDPSSGPVSISMVIGLSLSSLTMRRLKEWAYVVGLALLFALVMILLYEI